MESQKQLTIAGVLGGIAIIAAFLGVIGYYAVQTAVKTLRLEHVCVPYFSVYEAWIVGADGQGLDSVAVEMRDNSNYNLLYRTFTDSTGRFELFSDFYSFTLFDAPATCHVYVSAGGVSDTVLYKFERHRNCHFRKVEGPDTIRFVPPTGDMVLSLEEPQRVPVTDICSFAPWRQSALSPRAPSGLAAALEGWKSVRYGTLALADQRVLCAVLRSPEPSTPQAAGFAYYVLDRNLNGDLADERISPWLLEGTADPAACVARTCGVSETLVIGGITYHLDLTIERVAQQKAPLRYRCTDALQGYLTIDGRRYRALLWDWAMKRFTDLSTVVFAVDRDGDGHLSCDEGDLELYENARRVIQLSHVVFSIDTMNAAADRIQCRRRSPVDGSGVPAGVGSGVADIRASYRHPISLWQECGEHNFVVVFFFQGNGANSMRSPALDAFVQVMRERLGSVKLIGVNRAVTGPAYTDEPVIEENQGWHGPIVTRLRNHRDQEVVVIDSLATIVSRSSPGRDAVETLWQHLGRKDRGWALARYESMIGPAQVVGKTGE